MAKLGSYYSLCPLIDTKSLINVSDDPQEGVVIVTLDRNIASRYKISDQKQLTCWRTKEKFSSSVLFYTNKSKYVAIFNQYHIKLWDKDDNLDKLKKYKFNKPIHTLIKIQEEIFILFQNGAIHNLQNALEDRKTLNPVGLDLNQIDHVLYKELKNQFYFGLVSENMFYWMKFEENKYKCSKIVLTRKDLSVKGFVFHILRDAIYLLTLWSDGSIFSRCLEDPSVDESIGDLFTVIDSVSSKYFVSMKSLDENYIALYGADRDEEGAMLALYNVQFKVTQSKQPFKLFTNNSKIWCVQNNLLLPVGQNLAVIPFHLETEQLAALVGSHKDKITDVDPEIKIVQDIDIASWNTGRKVKDKNLPDDLKIRIDEYLEQGLPESLILEEMLPEMFEKNSCHLLILLLDNFTDIPEKYLVKILNHALTDIKKNSKVVTRILHRCFSEVLILPYLRSDLSIDKVADLLEHIYTLWLENFERTNTNSIETDKKLLEWTCVLIDSNYPKIVLSKDKLILETLTKLNEFVQKYLSSLETLNEVVPLLSNIKRNKNIDRCYSVNNLRYSVEQISLY